MGAKNRRIFIRALEFRQAKIAAIRVFGWSWSAVADHFANDYLLGGMSGACYAKAWSRLIADGKTPDVQAVESAKTEILTVGGLKPGLWVLEYHDKSHDTGMPTGEEADVVRRMRIAAKLAKSGQGKALD